MSLVAQIKELKKLHEQGVLDDEEFEAAKETLLGIRKPPTPVAMDLSAKTVKELKALCKTRGITVKSRARKAELIAALSAPTPEPTPPMPAPPKPPAAPNLAQALMAAAQSSGTLVEGSLEAAIKAASPGDTLRIPAGTRACRLVIDKDLTLIGDSTVLTPLEPAGELAHFANTIAALKTLSLELADVRKARDTAQTTYKNASALIPWTKTRLNQAYLNAENAFKAVLEKHKKQSRLLAGKLEAPLLVVRDANVTLEGICFQAPADHRTALRSTAHRKALGLSVFHWSRSIVIGGPLIRVKVSRAEHGLTMKSCEVDGGKTFTVGIRAHCPDGSAVLHLKAVNLHHFYSSEKNVEASGKDVWKLEHGGLYVDWSVKGPPDRIQLTDCRFTHAHSGLYLRRCSGAVLKNPHLEQIATFGVRVFGKADRSDGARLTLSGGSATDIADRSVIGYAWSESESNAKTTNLKHTRAGVAGNFVSPDLKKSRAEKKKADAAKAEASRKAAAAKTAIAEAKAKAKRTGKSVAHPAHANVLLKPDSKLAPAAGYTWVDAKASGDFRVKKKPPAKKPPAKKPPAKKTLADAKAEAKRTGESVAHPGLANVLVKPTGKLSPAAGYTWVDAKAANDFRVKKKPAAPAIRRKALSQMPQVAGPISKPGGMFSNIGVYRVRFCTKAFFSDDDGLLVAGTSPEHAVGGLFRDKKTGTISLSWHYTERRFYWRNGNKYFVDNVRNSNLSDAMAWAHSRNDLQALLSDGQVDFVDPYDATDAILQLDPIGNDIPGAIRKGWVKVSKITSRSQLRSAERDGYLPFNASNDNYCAHQYI